MSAPGVGHPVEMAVTTDEREDGRFLERWSRRKRDNESEKERRIDTPDDAGPSAVDPDERRLELEKNRKAAEAIDLDSLDADSDFSPFLKDGVPRALKAAAMRVLWRSNPVFANLDGLNDYDENFANPELIKKFAGSAWQVGKGYLFDDDNVDGQAIEDSEDIADAEEATSGPGNDQGTTGKDGEKEKIDPSRPDVAQTGIQSEEAASGQEEEGPVKVSLRQRLALDDWQDA